MSDQLALTPSQLDQLANQLDSRRLARRPDPILSERDSYLARLQEERRLERVREDSEAAAHARQLAEIAEERRAEAWEHFATQREAALAEMVPLETRLTKLHAEIRDLEDRSRELRETATRFAPHRNDTASRLRELAEAH